MYAYTGVLCIYTYTGVLCIYMHTLVYCVYIHTLVYCVYICIHWCTVYIYIHWCTVYIYIHIHWCTVYIGLVVQVQMVQVRVWIAMLGEGGSRDGQAGGTDGRTSGMCEMALHYTLGMRRMLGNLRHFTHSSVKLTFHSTHFCLITLFVFGGAYA